MNIFDFSIHTRLDGERPFVLQADCRSRARRLALVGASGAGKSLTMQIVAGLFPAQHARIVINGQVLVDTARRVWLPPQQRRIGLVFQDFALFPHLTVAQNIAFGLHTGWRNPPRRPFAPAVREWLAQMELEAVADRYPHQISGGQKQRTALARACIGEPRCLLLDEPFSALDTALRRQMRDTVARLQSRLHIPMLLISHDEADVRALADEVIRIEQGRTV